MVEARIKGLSEARRLPRLGRIRLGIKKISPKTGKEYPVAVDYFVCPPEIQKVFGEQPKALKIMFPIEDETRFFSQNYKRYGSSTLLKCRGDGERALEATEQGLVEKVCPGEECEHRQEKSRTCNRIGVLQVLLPDVPGAGAWQITTGSVNSIININSGIDYIRALCGRIAMIPLTLKIEPQDVAPDGKRKTVHVLALDMNIKLADLQRAALVEPTRCMLSLPAPEEVAHDEPLEPEFVEQLAEAAGEGKPEAEAPQEPAETPRPPEEKAKTKGQKPNSRIPITGFQLQSHQNGKAGEESPQRQAAKDEIRKLILKIVGGDTTKLPAKFKKITGYDKFPDVPDDKLAEVVSKVRMAYGEFMKNDFKDPEESQ